MNVLAPVHNLRRVLESVRAETAKRDEKLAAVIAAVLKKD